MLVILLLFSAGVVTGCETCRWGGVSWVKLWAVLTREYGDRRFLLGFWA